MNAPRSSDGVGHEEDRHVAGRRPLSSSVVARRPLRDAADEVLQPRLLVPVRGPRSRAPDRLRVDVDAEYVVALARQHGGERCAELAQPDDRDPHGPPASAVIRRCQPNARSNLRNSRCGHPRGSTAPSRSGTRRSRGSGTGRRGRRVDLADLEPCALDELPAFAARVGECDGAADLRLRVPRDSLLRVPEPAVLLTSRGSRRPSTSGGGRPSASESRRALPARRISASARSGCGV